MIPVIDMHCDTIAVMNGGWHPEEHPGHEKISLRQNSLNVDLERMKASGYLCQCFALFTHMREVEKAGRSPYDYVCELSDLFDREMAENSDLIRPVRSASDIRKNQADGMMSALKTVEEGAVYEGSIEKLHCLYDKGVRKSTLTWNFVNELGYPNPADYDETLKEAFYRRLDTENGLTQIGADFVREMESIGMIIDISHLNDAGITDIFRIKKPETPIVASHSNARGQAFHPRNLSDEMIRRLADCGGVTGINFYAGFLNGQFAYAPRSAIRVSRIEDMIAQIRYIRNIGGIDVIGIGTDFDGISGQLEINGAGEIQKLADAMSIAGFTTDEIEKVFYRNVLRVYDTVLK